MTDAQTEAWAIPLFVRGSMTDEEYSSLVEKIATALAAKDAELAVLRAELNDCASEIHDLRAQIERAEAQLAEARKALEKIYIEARSLPLHTSVVTREYVLTSKLAVIRDAVRRALTGGKNNHVR